MAGIVERQRLATGATDALRPTAHRTVAAVEDPEAGPTVAGVLLGDSAGREPAAAAALSLLQLLQLLLLVLLLLVEILLLVVAMLLLRRLLLIIGRLLAVGETHQGLAHQVLVRVGVPLLLIATVRAQVVAAGSSLSPHCSTETVSWLRFSIFDL